MRGTKDPFDKVGLGQLTWVIRVYLCLLLFFSALLFISAVPNVPEEASSLAIEGIKTIIAVLLGALSQRRA